MPHHSSAKTTPHTTHGNKAQQTALAEMKKRQAEFATQVKKSIGDKLEEHILTIIERPPFNQALNQYDAPEALRTNALEIAMSPIIQLVEVKGFGAAAVFAERILQLNGESSFLDIFNQFISKVPLKAVMEEEKRALTHLQISMANLVTIFNFNYSIFSVYALKTGKDVLTDERIRTLRTDISQFISKLVREILIHLQEEAKNQHLDLNALKARYLEETSKATINEAWKEQVNYRRLVENDAAIARRYLIDSFQSIEHEIYCSMNPLKEDELQKWLDKAIQFLTIPDYRESFGEYCVNRELDHRILHYTTENSELSKKLQRYINLYKDLGFIHRLKTIGIAGNVDKFLAMNDSTKAILSRCIRNYPEKSSRLIPKCSSMMLQQFDKILSVTNNFPEIDLNLLSQFSPGLLDKILSELGKAYTRSAFDVNQTISQCSPLMLERFGQILAVKFKFPNIDLNLLSKFSSPLLDHLLADLCNPDTRTDVDLNQTIAQCSTPMLERFGRILAVKTKFPRIDIKLLHKFSGDDLDIVLTQLSQFANGPEFDVNQILGLHENSVLVCLQFWLSGNNSVVRFDMRKEFVESLLHNKLSETAFSFILNSKFPHKIINLVSQFSEPMQQKFLQGRMEPKCLSILTMVARRYPGTDGALLEAILTHPYFAKRFQRNLRCNAEIDFILKNTTSLAQFKTIYGDQGLACDEKGYLSIEDQFKIPYQRLAVIQEILLGLGKNPEPLLVKGLLQPEVVEAYQAKFIDLNFIRAMKPAELRQIGQHWKKAQSQGIENVWDQRFAKLVTEKTPLQSHNMWTASTKEPQNNQYSPLYGCKY